MSRDFILILGGGVVSLVTTLVVLFVSDYIYRRDELLYRKSLPPPRPIGSQGVSESVPDPADSNQAASAAPLASGVAEGATAKEHSG